MKSKIFKLSLVLLIIIALVSTNFIVVGANLISYAVDESTLLTKTNSENVAFSTYFKNENGEKVTKASQDINLDGLKLFLKVDVKKEGYFTGGEVKLENSNFKFTNSVKSEYVNSSSESKLTLNQINAGSSIEIEVPIQYGKTLISNEKISADSLEKESTIQLTGIYKDSTEQNVSIIGTRTVTLSLTDNSSDSNTTNELSLITNRKLTNTEGKEKRILQFSLKLGLQNNTYPINKINAQLNVPKLNGKDPNVECKVNQNSTNDYNYNYENNIITINLENKANEQNNIIWKNSGYEEVILTYTYDDTQSKFNDETVTSKVNLTLYNGKNIIAQDSSAVVNEKEVIDMNSVVTLGINEGTTREGMDGIYKGSLNAGENEEYYSNLKIDVNATDIANTVSVIEEASKFNTNGGNVASQFKTTYISKKQIINVLGEDGILTIQTKDTNAKQVIATIDKTSQEDENGNINITYPTEISAIEIVTTKPVKVGTIELKSNKEILASSYEKESKITKIENIETSVHGTYNVYNSGNNSLDSNSLPIIKEQKGLQELKDTKTQAKLEINKDSLSTMTINKNVEIKVILVSNSPKYDLYKNPSIQIELPSDTTNIDVNYITKVYGDEFTNIIPKKGVINGKQVIQITLEGEQNKYKDVAIEGTTIIINANITLNNKATNKDDKYTMTYTNEKATSYDNNAIDEVPVSVVSPKGLITTNDIDALEIQTIGDEEKITKNLEKGVSGKTLIVNSQIINNNENEINNLQILGDFGTNGTLTINGEDKENNVNAQLKSAISIEGVDTTKIKVYYSENAKATNDLTNKENGWKDNITDVAKTEKYLITVTNMAITESINVKYDIEIPANLDYNKQMYEGYVATYTDTKTGTNQQINSTIIELSTGKGPQAETKLTASIAGEEADKNEEVKKGEIIKYTANITNTGSEDIKNAKISSNIPEGTSLVESTTDGYKDVNSNQTELTIDSLKAGETTTKSFEVKVDSNAKEGNEIKETVNLMYGEVTKTSNEVLNTVSKDSENAVSVTITDNTKGQVQYIAGEIVDYVATLKNTTNSTIQNLELKWNLGDGLTLTTQRIVDSKKDVDVKNNVKIDSIAAGEQIQVYGAFKVEKTTTAKDINIYATAIYNGNEYRSNGSIIKIITTDNCDVKLSANSENAYVKAGENIVYTIKIKNNNAIDLSNVYITDEIPSNLTVQAVNVIDNTGKETKIENTNNNVYVSLNLAKQEEKTVQVKTLVDYKENAEEDVKITNQATVEPSASATLKTNEVSHILEQTKSVNENNNSNNTNTQNNGTNNQSTTEQTYKISGIAWIDNDSNGQMDDIETMKSGISVKLVDITTNQVAKNASGNEITSTTDNSGFYTLSDIPKGQYIVVFDYNSSEYILSEYKKQGVDDSKSSKVINKTLNINNEEKTYAVTDTITVNGENIANINIGMKKSEKFDLKLDKYISKVMVQNKEGTKSYNFNNETLAKIELNSKSVNGTTVIIEYNIVVTNVGEIEGYAKNIADYLPSDLKFSSELNKDWYQSGNNVNSNSLSNQKISAGESKQLKLTVTKTMNEDNTGLINNMAEIAESYNEQGTTDINSTAGNKKQGENDMGSAYVIISIKTGSPILYTTLIIIVIAAIGAGVYFIKKKTLKQDNKKESRKI